MELIHLQSTAQGRCKPGTQSYVSHAFSYRMTMTYTSCAASLTRACAIKALWQSDEQSSACDPCVGLLYVIAVKASLCNRE